MSEVTKLRRLEYQTRCGLFAERFDNGSNASITLCAFDQQTRRSNVPRNDVVAMRDLLDALLAEWPA